MVADCSRFSSMRATSPVVFCWQEGRWSCVIVWIKGAGVSWNTRPDVGKKSGWGGRDGYILYPGWRAIAELISEHCFAFKDLILFLSQRERGISVIIVHMGSLLPHPSLFSLIPYEVVGWAPCPWGTAHEDTHICFLHCQWNKRNCWVDPSP